MKRLVTIIGLFILTHSLCAAERLSGTALSGEGWRGVDLGQPYVITQVGWQPTSTTTAELGLFEGANRSDFMDAIPLYMHPGASKTNQMNYAEVNCSRGFRYVRYRKSDLKGEYKIAALEFYGTQGAGDDSHLSQLTNLPTVVIHTQNDEVPYDKEHEITCLVTIISDNGASVLTDTALIRERGNYSRGFPKKPYRIKFAHKHHILGSPANAKKWTLINNYGDKTLMRNQLAFELSRRFGMPYTPFCAYVDVILNGDYKGCYQLCDQIEVRKNRVEVTEMSPTDNSGDALTGGYLIEADAYAYDETSMFWSSQGTGVTIKSPKADSITWQQASYIEQRYDAMEANWQKYLDLNTFLRHFLVGELSGNTDTYWSMYLYKQRSNDTLFVGPVWDFDLAFENDNRTYPINDLSDYIYRTKGSTTGYLKTLVDKIVVYNSNAKKQLRTLWAQTRQAGMTTESLLRYVDEQAQLLEQSQQLNFTRWPIMQEYVHQNPRIWGSYDAEVNNVRHFLQQRIEWMDTKLQFDTATLSVEPVETQPMPQATKIVRDGQLLIIRNNQVYTPTGNRLQ
ncbi:MAG: CotH kinase family protein [Paludibacteraceae bacterium]|nr:CotH kinase family protein [Paludibacteraceae bacterium]